MFCVMDNQNLWTPVKSGVKTASQANNWCKKNLPLEITHLWGAKPTWDHRYFVVQK